MTLICGIDEAGRGPLLGPMVIAGVLVDEKGSEELKSMGIKDSKLLSHKKRQELYKQIIAKTKYKILVVSPKEIDAALNSEKMNLNWLEAHTSAKIINKLKPDKAIIDCPSINTTNYQQYLVNLLNDKGTKMIVEHKADANYIESSAASILAKVTREEEIGKIKKRVGDFGSGYPSDPKTIKFLEEHGNDYPDVFRKTWSPYKKKFPEADQSTINDFEVDDNGR